MAASLAVWGKIDISVASEKDLRLTSELTKANTDTHDDDDNNNSDNDDVVFSDVLLHNEIHTPVQRLTTNDALYSFSWRI